MAVLMDIKNIGSKIVKARKKIDMSQAQLAQLLFISPQAVGKWERGESVPDIVTVSRLAEILAVDLNYFSEQFPSAVSETQQTAQQGPTHIRTVEKQLLTNFSGSNLPESDFAGVVAHDRKFNGSALRGANFENADLTGSLFTGSDMRESNFDGANLTDCTFSANDLSGVSFDKAVLVHTRFKASGLNGARFSDANLRNVILTKTDLRKTKFENCIFEGVDFKYSDLSGVCFDEQTFIAVMFPNTALNNASFKGATLKNVSFRSTMALTNKYYRAIGTICFDGAKMDKLTYAALKGFGADLAKVITI